MDANMGATMGARENSAGPPDVLLGDSWRNGELFWPDSRKSADYRLATTLRPRRVSLRPPAASRPLASTFALPPAASPSGPYKATKTNRQEVASHGRQGLIRRFPGI